MKFFLVFFLWVVVGSGTAFARTENGITLTDEATSKSNIIQATFFEAYNPPGTGTFYYNPASEVTSTAGAVTCKGIYTARTLLLSVPTLGSTSISVRIEGKTKNATTWAEVYTKTFTAASTIDSVVNVVEYLDQIRIGVKANTSKGTDSVNVTGSFISSY
jgi:hypothetical protein